MWFCPSCLTLLSVFSRGSQQFEVADVWYVPTLRRDQHDWPSPQRQEAKIPDQVKEQQLVSQFQRNLPLVSGCI